VSGAERGGAGVDWAARGEERERLRSLGGRWEGGGVIKGRGKLGAARAVLPLTAKLRGVEREKMRAYDYT